MTTPAQKANLARIRDNQRRSRARRRQYVQGLEQRLRACELQGIEASSEVQAAARRVADENRHLRDLLQKQGLPDEYVVAYVQAALNGDPPPAEFSPAGPSASTTQFSSAGLGAGGSVQVLQQLLEPRRPGGIDPSASYPMSGQASRETSSTSASTTTGSSLWEAPQHGNPATYSHHQQQPVNMPPTAIPAPPVAQPYGTQMYSGGSAPRMDPFPGQPLHPQQQPHHQQQQQQQQQSSQQPPQQQPQQPPPGTLIEDSRQQPYLPQQMSPDVPGAVPYNDPSAPYQPNTRHYGPPGGYS